MNYYSMSIDQLIAKIKEKDKELRILREKMECFSEMQKNLEIVGRQNKRLKKDNERYGEILDRNPAKQTQPPQEGRGMNWIRTKEKLPPEGKVVMTKIHDDEYPRNEKPLKRKGNLWYLQDGSMYVYYTPTHWKEVRESERH